MNKIFGCIVLLLFAAVHATESLHPIAAPATSFGVQGTIELNDDVYSGDMEVSANN